MTCNDRQLTEQQRQDGYQNQRTGVVQAVRPFSGSPTIPNLIDYLNREVYPALRSSRAKINDVHSRVTDNAPSGNPLQFYFSADTANADPTTGFVRLNQATQNTATVIRVSQTNARLQDVAPWLDVMAGGATTPLGTITLSDVINPARFLRFDLDTMVDQGDYWDLGVTIIESSHDNPFVQDGGLAIAFTPGVAAAGATVPPGAISPIGDDAFLANISGAPAAPTAVALTTLAGDGLTGGANAVLAVGAGTGITVNANDVAVTIPLTDGDKGDITVSSSGATWTIDNDAVTDAKLRNSAALSVIGRASNTSGDPADIASTAARHALITNSAGTAIGWRALETADIPAHTWAEVLAAGAGSGANNPVIASGQYLGFGASPPTLGLSERLRSDGNFVGYATGQLVWVATSAASMQGTTVQITASSTDATVSAASGNVVLATSSTGFVSLPSFLKFTTEAAASTPSMSAGQGLVWVRSDTPNVPMFTDDGNTDHVLQYRGEGMLADGDKGDITVSGSFLTWTIDNDVVSNAKLTNMAAATIKGRAVGAGTGDPTDLTAAQLGQIVRFSGQEDGATATGTYEPTLAATTSIYRINPASGDEITFTGFAFADGNAGHVFLLLKQGGDGRCIIQHNVGVTASNGCFLADEQDFILTGANQACICWYQTSAGRWNVVGAKIADRDYGDITVSVGGRTWTIDNDVVSDAKLRNSAALSVIGRSANSSGDPADIAAANDHEVLRRNGTSLGFGTLSLGAFPSIADDAFLANIAGSPAQPTAVALSTLAGDGLQGGADAVLNIDVSDFAGTGLEDDGSENLRIAASAAGNGLTGGGGSALAVGAGTGITVAADSVSVTIPLTDGDKGDITVSSSGTVFTVDTDAISNAKLANMAERRIKGRADSAGTGDPTDLTGAQVGAIVRWGNQVGDASTTGSVATLTVSASTNLYTFNSVSPVLHGMSVPTEIGQVVAIQHIGSGETTVVHESGTAGAAAQRFRLGPFAANTSALVIRQGQTALFTYDNRWLWIGGAGALVDGDKGDITVSSAGGTWTIDNNAVTDAKLRDSAALSVIGRSANSSGDPADIAAANDGEVLRRSGTTLGFGTVATAGIADAAVTLAKMENRAQSTIIGRAEGGGTGVPQALTPTQVVAIIDGESPTWTGTHTFTGPALRADVTTDDVRIGATAGGVGLFAGLASTNVTAGFVSLQGSELVEVETNGVNRLRIEADGAWRLSGSSYGTAGELLRSGGSAAPPTWATAAQVVDLIETTLEGRAMAWTASHSFASTVGFSAGVTFGSNALFSGAVRFNSVMSSSTSVLDDFTLNAGTNVLRLSALNWIVAGIEPQADGQMLVIVNVHASGTAGIHMESLSSSAANRFAGTGTSRQLRAGEAVIAWYDGTSSRWRLVGGLIDPAS